MGWALIFFTLYLTIKHTFRLNKNRVEIVEYGIESKEINLLIVSAVFYIGVAIAVVLPISLVSYVFYPVPIIIALLFPGIFFAYKIEKNIQLCGKYYKNVILNDVQMIRWIGVGVMIYLFARWFLSLVIGLWASSQFP